MKQVQPHNGSDLMHFPSGPYGHLWQDNLVIFRHFKLTSPGSMPEQNYKINITTLGPTLNTDIMAPKTVADTFYNHAQPKDPCSAWVWNWGPRRHPYHISLRTPLTNELPSRWIANEEVLQWLREVKARPSTKPQKPSKNQEISKCLLQQCGLPIPRETHMWIVHWSFPWRLPHSHLQVVPYCQ